MSKNYKGGYKIVSLNGVSLVASATPVTISGIYDAIESSYGKPLLLSDIVVGGVEKNDVYVDSYEVVSSKYVIKAYGLVLEIASTDAVTISEDNGLLAITNDNTKTFKDADITKILNHAKRGGLFNLTSTIINDFSATINTPYQAGDSVQFQTITYANDSTIDGAIQIIYTRGSTDSWSVSVWEL